MTAPTTALEVGDFIEIPAWRVTGCVMGIEAAPIGSDECIDVYLQERPDQTCRFKRYRLEPSEYVVTL